MNLELVILNFAMGAKRAQMVLNAENLKDAQAIQQGAIDTPTGGGGAGSSNSLIPHIPLAIKEATFSYKLKCSMNFSIDMTLGVSFFVKVETTIHRDSSEEEELNLSITFLNIMSLTAEANG